VKDIETLEKMTSEKYLKLLKGNKKTP